MTNTASIAPRRHEERSAWVPGAPDEVFAFADDHQQFSGHMASSSWMMLGSKMSTRMDAAGGRAVGSHITVDGSVLGVRLSVDEVVTERLVSVSKTWETVGEPRLFVIGSYRMGFEVARRDEGTTFRVFIDYALPQRQRWLGDLLGKFYAGWCVTQMVKGVERRFRHPAVGNAAAS